MSMLRYTVATALFLVCAVAIVKWQTSPQEKISFTPPAAESNITEAKPKGQTKLSNAVVGSEEDLPYQPLEATPAVILERPLPHAGAQLSDEQLATQISIAQQQLQQVEAVNQRKQAQFQKILAQESTAEKSLLEAELAYQIGGWRDAWQAGEIDQYLSYYSEAFQPKGRETFEQWKRRRLRLVNATRSIELQMEDFEVSYDPATNRSLVTFTQFYESENYKDVSKKRIIFENQQDRWMIVSETTE